MKYINTNSTVECVHKDVVIIGNGPSGITLSYMLAGNWPYWDSNEIDKHPDELLRARLACVDSKRSLVEQDLLQLAEGLEGRSTNPVSLLLDSLQNPCADIGLEVPSMLKYHYLANKEIDHVVLGTGPPGGSFHRMDPNLRTLSLAGWMSLPGLDFNTWMAKQSSLEANNEQNDFNQKTNNDSRWWQRLSHLGRSQTSIIGDQRNNARRAPANTTTDSEVKLLNDNKTVSTELVRTPVPRRILSVRRQVSREVQTRALVSHVAQYYENYVKEMNLERYFRNNTIVTSIKAVPNSSNKCIRWLVKGVHSNGQPFMYTCHSVVLANGASDLANRLEVHGEDSNDWIKHDLPALESALEKIPDVKRSELKPVLIIGAGLSAADAVTICRSSGIRVVHVYRNRSAGLDKMLPETVYPEYHEVHKMMKDCNNTYDLYSPLPEHTIVEFVSSPTQDNSMPHHRVILRRLNTGETTTVDVSFCAILIGFRPDLNFLDPMLKCLDAQADQNCDDADEKVKLTDDTVQLTKDYQLPFAWPANFLGRRITWLKNLCAKCRHLSLCERSRRHDANRKTNAQQHPPNACECSKNRRNDHSPNNHANDNNNNNLNSNCRKFSHIESCDSQTDKKLNHSTAPTLTKALGEDPTKPIDCKTNPIAVDKFSNEVLHVPYKGLYAMGPLVGDNFIRFIAGGALAITSALHKQR